MAAQMHSIHFPLFECRGTVRVVAATETATVNTTWRLATYRLAQMSFHLHQMLYFLLRPCSSCSSGCYFLGLVGPLRSWAVAGVCPAMMEVSPPFRKPGTARAKGTSI